MSRTLRIPTRWRRYGKDHREVSIDGSPLQMAAHGAPGRHQFTDAAGSWPRETRAIDQSDPARRTSAEFFEPNPMQLHKATRASVARETFGT